MKIGVILQARTSSSRLPNKVLKNLPFDSSITVIQQIIRRLKKSNKVDEIIVATTNQESDAAIVAVAKKEKTKCFRGSLQDVLERYYLAAKEHHLDVIVRITADCPCIDPHIVDLVITTHLRAKADFTSNVLERSYPDGLDVEVLNFDVLEQMYFKAKSKHEREHVTAYIYKHRRNYKIINVKAPSLLFAPARRITLDTAQDYAVLCMIYDELYSKDRYFTAQAVMKLYQQKPWMDWINA